MSYVNDWSTGGVAPTPLQRSAVNYIVEQIIESAKSQSIQIGDITGERIDGYKIDHNGISLNGVGENSCAGFYLDWDFVNVRSGHCNTRRHSYDAVVVAILITLDNVFEGFQWRSDGDGEDTFKVTAMELLDGCSNIDEAIQVIQTRESACLQTIWSMGIAGNGVMAASAQP